MRDILIAAAVGLLTLVAVVRPDIGALGWAWLSIMNPHRLTWGFAQELPVAAMVGGATLVGILFYTGLKRLPLTPPVVALLGFDLWMIPTHFLGFYPELAEPLAFKILKIQLMVFVTILLLHSRKHIEALVWVLVASLGYYGVKGGVFTIATGGEHRVWGPAESFINGNNEIALALIIIIPLMRYLQLTAKNQWIRRGMLAAMLLSSAAALGSQSRGALLAITAMAALLWWRSNQRAMGGLMIGVVALALVLFMPSSWEERMSTIQTYEQDTSAMQRITVWKMTWNLALDHPVFGGGHAIYTPDNFVVYAGGAYAGGLVNAHSIYFSVLGEHGFVGLLLFLGVWYFTWKEANWIRSRCAPDGELRWAYWLASMIQVSLIGYLVGGAFLYLAYFDLPYYLLILVVITKEWIRRGTPAGNAQEAGARTGTGPALPRRTAT